MDAQQALSATHHSIIPIAAFTATGDLDKLRPALHEGLEAGLTVNEIKIAPFGRTLALDRHTPTVAIGVPSPISSPRNYGEFRASEK